MINLQFKRTVLLLCVLIVFTLPSHAQSRKSHGRQLVAFGPGFGLDHGGFGAQLITYPLKNVGLFAGLGYAVVDVGYNVGVKLALSFKRDSIESATPYLIGTYGYNTAFNIANKPQLNKLFYGPSAGLGVDFHFGKDPSKRYASFAIIYPFRTLEAMDYYSLLKNQYRVEFPIDLLPITLSAGLHFVLADLKKP